MSALLCASAMTAVQAAAQENDEPISVTESEDAAYGDTADTITVTGSRIRRPDYQFSNPVTSVDDSTIRQSGATNLTDFAQDFPALIGSVDSEDNADTGNQAGVGLNLLNLRNLGADRTLVLVDGLRHVASEPGTSAVDINTIPVGLVERIEILTGGASAVYGADGVSGVVNFVLKDDFEGLDLRAQAGRPDGDGGQSQFVSALAGKNFLDDRLNVTLSGEVSLTGAVDRDDRDYAALGQREVLTDNPDDPGTFGGPNDPNILSNVFARNLTYIDTSPGGSIYTDFDFGDSLAGVDFTGDGQPWEDGVFAGGFTAIGGDGSPLDGFVDQLLPQLDRYSTAGSFDFQATDKLSFNGDVKFVRTETSFIAQPTFDFFIPISIDNPFIPAAALADANGPDGLGAIGEVYVARDNFDLGNTGRDITRDTIRTVVGAEYEFTPDWALQASYVYGQTEETSDYFNDRQADRFAAAIDAVIDPATGDVTCRSNLDGGAAAPYLDDPSLWGTTFTPGANSGCVAANIFGENISPEARAFINTTTTSSAKLEQHVFNAYVTGNSSALFELPGGPVGVVAGLEYREEKSVDRAAPVEKQADELGFDITWSGQAVDSTGAFDVMEYFGEVDLPLLSDIPLIRELTIDAAYRYSDYSTTGSSSTWKVGGLYSPVNGLTFRGTTAEAVRAPNISELFLPQSQAFALLADPCTVNNIDQAETDEQNALRLQNCVADLGQGRIDDFNPNVSSSVEGRIGGNPDLDVETAKTNTYGFVYQPHFVDGLTISVDYYDISLEDAIQFFEAQTIVDKCYDLPRPNQFCPLISRDLAGDGRIDSFQQFAVNVASYQTSGYDMSARYNLDPQALGLTDRNVGQIQFSLVGSKLDELTFTEIADADPDEDAGEPGAPEWQAVFDATWTGPDGKMQLNYGYSWFSETDRFSEDAIAREPDIVDAAYYDYSARSVHDVQARYAISDRFSVYGGINNFTNQEPDRGSLNLPVNPLGRFFYLGAQVNFDQLGGF